MLEPYEALESAETALRLIIRLVVGEQWQRYVDQERLEKIRQRAVDDERRNGVITSKDLLDFTEFRDLRKVISTRWGDFKKVFDDEERLKVYLNLFEDVRNPIAHPRPIVEFERELLSGMARQIRQQIALYRLRQNPAHMHYPVIESVRDEFGRESTAQSYPSSSKDTPWIPVGSTVEITCTAFDERGRELHWFIGGLSPEKLNNPAVGESVKLSHTFPADRAGENFGVSIYLRSTGKHHRKVHSHYTATGDRTGIGYDDERWFTFNVIPEDD